MNPHSSRYEPLFKVMMAERGQSDETAMLCNSPSTLASMAQSRMNKTRNSRPESRLTPFETLATHRSKQRCYSITVLRGDV